jgi:hypothetical protein
MTRITKTGTDTVIPVSQDDLRLAGLGVGDELTCLPVKGGLFFTSADPAQARMMAAGLADMDERPEIYKKLAE